MKKKILALLLAVISLVNVLPAYSVPAVAQDGIDGIPISEMTVGSIYSAVFKTKEANNNPNLYLYNNGASGEAYENPVISAELPSSLTVTLENEGDTYLRVTNADWPLYLSDYNYVDPADVVILELLDKKKDEQYIKGLVTISCDQAENDLIILNRSEKLYAFAELADEISHLGRYQWQVRLSDGLWATIGTYSSYYIGISYALLANVIKDGASAVRCVVNGNDASYVSNELEVKIDSTPLADNTPFISEPIGSVEEMPSAPFAVVRNLESSVASADADGDNATEIEPASEPIEEPETTEETTEETAEETTTGVIEEVIAEDPDESDDEATAEGSINTVEETDAETTDDDHHITPNPITPTVEAFHIVISYTYFHANEAQNQNINGSTAANTFTITLPQGAHYTGTVASPPVLGYLPYIEAEYKNYVTGYDAQTNPPKTYAEITQTPYGEDNKTYVLANSLDFVNVTSHTELKVYYFPQTVNYTVKIYDQNLHDDEYFLSSTQIHTGIANAPVSDKLDVERYGFSLPPYDKNTAISEDGSTVIELYYDRLYYLVTFDLNAGDDEAYGAQNFLLRYEYPLYLPKPTRPGYAFTEWTLDRVYNIVGETEVDIDDAGTRSLYNVKDAGKSISARHNIHYVAGWIKQTTSYTVIYWLENADNDGFTLDSFKTVSGVAPGDRVSASDSLTKSDKNYFTYNDTLSDHNVTVKGDGTTAVNAYYLRNYYTLTFNGNTKCMYEHTCTPECPTGTCTKEVHVHSEKECGVPEIICNLPEHTHINKPVADGGCLVCPIEEHTTHTDECLTCEKVVHDTHNYNCYNALNKTNGNTTVTGEKIEGYVGRSGRRSYTYWVYINGTWYQYKGSSADHEKILAPSCHQHSSKCYSDNLHIHSEANGCYSNVAHKHTKACFKYDCTKQEHTHGGDCVRKCQLPKHQHTTACQNSYTKDFLKVSYKYGADISSVWRQIWTVFNSGERWQPNTYYSQVLVYLPFMPPANIKFTKSTSSEDTYEIKYYLEALDKSGNEYDDKFFNLNNTVNANYNYLTLDEDFFDILGFTQYKADPAFGNNDQLNITGGGEVDLYYTRNVYELKFVSNGFPLDEYTRRLMYQQPIESAYDLLPSDIPYPSNVEPGAVQFAGWYTTPSCADGTEFFFDGKTPMPLGGIVLYAKWEDCSYTANIYFEPEMETLLGEPQTVIFDSFLQEPDYKQKQQSDDNYKNLLFAGWYYKDGESEVRFDFNTMTLKQDLDIYAKWSSNIPVNYKIYYVFDSTGNGDYVHVADPLSASSIAGKIKNFTAPVGDALYEKYREGHYPLVRAHTMVMSADKENVYYFIYTNAEEIKYTVTHIFRSPQLTAIIGKDHLHEVFSHEISGNNAAESAAYVVVSFREGITKDIIYQAALDQVKATNELGETSITLNEAKHKEELWKIVTSISPDSYEEKLILQAEGENNITFDWETRGTTATYQIIHYRQSLDGSEYEYYSSTNGIGEIGKTATAALLPTDSNKGFTFTENNEKMSNLSGIIKNFTVENGQLTDGLILRVYYDRDVYNYIVQHYKNGTTTPLLPEPNTTTSGRAYYGTMISISDVAVDIEGYTLANGNDPEIKLTDNNQTIVCKYNGLEVQYRYQVIGSAGATFDEYTDTSAVGASPKPRVLSVLDGFRLNAWYYSVGNGPRIPVDQGWISQSEDKFVITVPPAPVEWAGEAVYIFAEVVPTTRKFRVERAPYSQNPQAFVFHLIGNDVQNANVDVMFCILGNGYMDIAMLPFGNYTVTVLEWSWRFGAPTATFNGSTQSLNNGKFNLELNTTGDVSFDFSKVTNDRWITDDDSVYLLFPNNE